eukprot:Opistho-2@24359
MSGAKGLLGSIIRKQSTPNAAHAPVKVSEEDAPQVESEYNIRKITELQSRFAGGETLLVPGRVFVREGTLLKQCRKNLKQRHFVLFNDILIYGTILARGHYAKQVVLPLSEVSFTGECHFLPSVYDGEPSALHGGEFDAANAFQINHKSKSFHVVAQNATDKANWLANLQKYILLAADGEGRMNQVAAVWVPDTAVGLCMVCKAAKFGPFNRKHHCRNCGKVVCHPCSTTTKVLAHISSKPQRICDDCVAVFSADGGGRGQQRPSLIPLGTVVSPASMTQKAPEAPSSAAPIAVQTNVSAAAPTTAPPAAAKNEEGHSEGDLTTDSDDDSDDGGLDEPAAPTPATPAATVPAPTEVHAGPQSTEAAPADAITAPKEVAAEITTPSATQDVSYAVPERNAVQPTKPPVQGPIAAMAALMAQAAAKSAGTAPPATPSAQPDASTQPTHPAPTPIPAPRPAPPPVPVSVPAVETLSPTPAP